MPASAPLPPTPHRNRVALRLAELIPDKVLANPERVLINVAAVLVGLYAFFPDKNSPVDQWNDWFQYEWGCGMILGGCAALHGYWRTWRPTERLGAGLICLGCCAYMVQLVDVLGLGRAAISAGVFLALAVAKAIRLIKSLAVSTALVERIADIRAAVQSEETDGR